MKKMALRFLTPTLLSLVASAALVACGGSDSPPAPPVADPVATASAATAASIGATAIAGASSDEEVYNLAADVGDSWQLVLNNKTNTYVTKVLSSQYGLSSTTAAAFAKTTVGSTTTVKATSGDALSVQIDARTKTVSGNITVGGKTASVAGTGYVIADVGKLAGNYFFAGSTRNVSDGLWRDTPLGGFIIAANGIDITLCDGSVAVNGVCTGVTASSPAISSKPLKIVKEGNLLRIKDGTKDFGILNVSAGDRGPVLIVDRFGLSDDTPPVARAGVFYGAKSAKLAGTEFDGSWTCNSGGADMASLVVTGNSYTVKAVNKAAQQGTLQYNKVYVESSNTTAELNGVLIARNNTEALREASLVLPLSSSLAILVDSPAIDSTRLGTEKKINVCRKA